MSLLSDLFGASGDSLTVDSGYVHGYADVRGKEVCVFVTGNGTYIDNAGALLLAGWVLECIEQRPGSPIVMLVDSKGQAPNRTAEMLGLASYFGHLLACLQVARQRGHRLVTVATGEAVGGAFICYGMFADRIYALDSATVGLMPISAIAAVTKIPEEALEALSKKMPALEFGAKAFAKLGGVVDVWSTKADLGRLLAAAVASDGTDDLRAQLGRQRKGRLRALEVREKTIAETLR